MGEPLGVLLVHGLSSQLATHTRTVPFSFRNRAIATYSEVGHVVKEDIDLDHLLNGGTGLLENGLEVLDALSRQLLDAALDEVALEVGMDLSRAVDGGRGLDGLGVRASGYDRR